MGVRRLHPAYRCIVVRFQLEDADYQRLLKLRTSLRQYMHWSELQAQAAGLTPAQHQLLLAVRGHDEPRGPTISDVAGYLLLKHHSTVELVKRAEALGLVGRASDPDDARVVRLSLTAKGAAALESLASLHLEELARLAGDLQSLWRSHVPGQAVDGAEAAAGLWPDRLYPVRARRIYDEPSEDDGTRVLVDRLWPRGLRKDTASVDHWWVEVAPSAQLRRWYGHKAERFGEFTDRYIGELRGSQARDSLDRLGHLAHRGPLTLLTAHRDLPRSGATVLAEEILRRFGEPGDGASGPPS